METCIETRSIEIDPTPEGCLENTFITADAIIDKFAKDSPTDVIRCLAWLGMYAYVLENYSFWCVRHIATWSILISYKAIIASVKGMKKIFEAPDFNVARKSIVAFRS